MDQELRDSLIHIVELPKKEKIALAKNVLEDIAKDMKAHELGDEDILYIMTAIPKVFIEAKGVVNDEQYHLFMDITGLAESNLSLENFLLLMKLPDNMHLYDAGYTAIKELLNIPIKLNAIMYGVIVASYDEEINDEQIDLIAKILGPKLSGEEKPN